MGCGETIALVSPKAERRQNLTRIATFLSLEHRGSGDLVHVINTHYDDMGVRARAESSLLIREYTHKWASDVENKLDLSRREGPVIIIGDLSQ
jgi:hypothetical protein